MASWDLRELPQKLSAHLTPWSRSIQFWVRAADIYSGYKACQLRTAFVRDAEKRDAMWERQHEVAAEKMFSLCSELGGLFLKAAQILGKPDLAPQLGFGEIFEQFDPEPVGSASIAQVHRARVKCAKTDVAVKVQHPGVQHLMMIDIHNLQAFVLFLQKTDIKFDLFSLTKEVEKQVGYEFDFLREAKAMERIRQSFCTNNKKSPVVVPRVMPGMVSRKILVMEFINGIPIMNLSNEIAKRGIDPGGKIAAMAKQKILKNLTLAYGQMILKDGFFHADPHPGNILICKDSEVALLDYGQVKQLPNDLRLGYANLILAVADNDLSRVAQSYKELGIETLATCVNVQQELLQLAQRMFDTKLPPGVTVMTPFSEESSLKKVAVRCWIGYQLLLCRAMEANCRGSFVQGRKTKSRGFESA
uniref:Protein kinase domain-containing protein n=1 Tax=Ananas comosus var. bracteatus TaxID=296719 RepID=A0A6V7QWG7_ANACO